MGRRRANLTPPGGREVFELRITLCLDSDGQQWVKTDCTDPDGPAAPYLHELLGAITQASLQLAQAYEDDRQANDYE